MVQHRRPTLYIVVSLAVVLCAASGCMTLAFTKVQSHRLAILSLLAAKGRTASATYYKSDWRLPFTNTTVYFHIAIDGEPSWKLAFYDSRDGRYYLHGKAGSFGNVPIGVTWPIDALKPRD